MIIAGCSKEVPRDPSEEPWVSDLSLPVPIEIGSSGFQFETKADMIETDNLGQATLRLLAVDKTSPLSETPTEDKSTLFVNEKAKYDKDKGKVVFDGDKTWYYPYASAHNYTFYAYHAGDQETEVLKNNNGDLYVQIDLNQYQSDILWAKAEATPFNGIDGFNAKFMRAIKDDKNSNDIPDGEEDGIDRYPSLEFHHLTTALSFNFQTTSGDDTANEQMASAKVKSLKLTNLPNVVQLCIAKRSTASGWKEGALKVPANNPTYSVEMSGCADVEMADVGSVTELGTMFVMVPSNVTTIQVDMQVSVALTSGGAENVEQIVPVKLNLTSADEGGFLVGSHYSYTIIMKSLEEIVVKATVDDWNDGTVGEDSSAIVDGSPSEGGLIIE